MIDKIGIIGAGNIGGVLAQEIPRRRMARTTAVVDIMPPDVAKGKCLDIAEGTPVLGFESRFDAGREYDVLRGSQIVINTAGVPRRPKPDGTLPTREELLATNLRITDQVAAGIKEHCPDAIIISIANPLDAIVYRLHQVLKPPRGRLMGMAGVLDSSRYRYFVAEAAGVSVENVEALVLGGHGDDMVPVRSCCRIGGIPVQYFLDDATLDRIEQKVRTAGADVVKLIGSGSAFVGPAWSALEMAEAIVFDKKKVLPVCAQLVGEYGVDGLFIGVPAVLGWGGAERILEIPLTTSETEALARSIGAVRGTCNEIDRLLAG